MAEFLEVIEWLDDTGTEIVHRIPDKGSAEVKFGAQLVVRENQAAVFFRDGKGYDVIGPGRHTLSTLNVPVMTKVFSLPFGFKSPFRVEIVFVNLKVFTHLKWGTRDPVAFRDKELGIVRLRAFGRYTFRIVQPLLFVNTMVGTQGIYTTEEIDDYLRDAIVSRFNDLLGERLSSVFELPQLYDELAAALKVRVGQDFQKYGIDLLDLFINSITPPDEVQKMIDEKSSLKALGDLDAFFKFKAARALEEAAKGTAPPDGVSAATTGMGLGVGAGMGMILPAMLLKGLKASPQEDAAYQECPKCFSKIALDSRFCPHCGHQIVKANACLLCGAELPAEANFCMLCGAKVEKTTKTCSKCGTKAMPEAVFCNRCGERLEVIPPEPR